MQEIVNYINGNTKVTILQDGTKIREYEGTPVINHFETCDVKISDYCDMGCTYCHESSTKAGKHGDLGKLMEILSEVPSGVELAIGGGNPLSHPDLIPFLQKLKAKGIIANLTINQGHLKTFQNLIVYLIKDDLVKGIGISITSNNFKYIEPLVKLTDHIVYHVIAGINSIDVIDRLNEISPAKVLILGYKTFGFGIDYYSPEVDVNIKEWYQKLHSYLGKCVISFDNLAIEQLNVKRLFTDKGWETFYCGDDFTFSQYIDAVKQEYAPTSRSKYRVPFNEMTLMEFFSKRDSNLV